MDIFEIIKMIFHPVFWFFVSIVLSIKKIFITFGEKWKDAVNNEEIEDCVVIGLLYTLFLIALGLVPMIPCIFIHNIMLSVITFFTLSFALISGWIWITDY